MYPAETSLIPVTVALLRFFESRGLAAFSQNYPYWYFGSTPYKFLIGPVVPVVVGILQRILINVSLFNITIYLIMFSIIISAVFWTILFLKIRDQKLSLRSFWPMLIFLIFPLKYLAAFAQDEATMIMAKNFLPVVFITTWIYLGKRKPGTFILVTATTVLLFLINTQILPDLLVGTVALCLAISFQEGKFKRLTVNLKTGLGPLLVALVLVTFWYTPGYWLTVLGNPGIGGARGLSVVLRVINLFRVVAPLVLAVLVVFFATKIKNRFAVFSLTWLLTFVFLTLYRFGANPAFWQDWTAWFFELEIGIFYLCLSFWPKYNFYKIIPILLPFLAFFVIERTMKYPTLISKTLPRSLQSLPLVANQVGSSLIFVSGSDTFWIEALADVFQVRGGRDEFAVNKNWNKLAYELREGSDSGKSLDAIKGGGISYVLVHTRQSLNYYHDFKNLTKWQEIGKEVWQNDGDTLLHF